MASRVKIDHGKLVAIVGAKTDAAAKRGAERGKLYAEQNVAAMGLVNTGRLLRSFRVRKIAGTDLIKKYRLESTDPKAKYPEFGTRGSNAKPGGVLVFKIGGKTIFARHTRPIRPYGFMRLARQRLKPSDFSTRT